ncbi:MAG: hypothetical protein M3437_09185 [Chloroflexota bacterium]|nr:hypothetical protein [Chloroflexota bacterium]MDQ5864519.1 hypothetical protein [Chloroflexota bacterium]
MQNPTGAGRNWKTIVAIAALLLLVGGLGAVLRFGAMEQGAGSSIPRVQQAQTSIAQRSTFAGPTPTLDCAAGLAWRVVGSPNLEAAGEGAPVGEGGEGDEEERGGSVLADVAALAPDDIWAVGSSHSGLIVETLVEHWDGKEWRLVFSEAVESRGSQLNSVAAVASNYVWAVGTYLLLDMQTVPLIQRWDGSEWRLVAPAPVSATVGTFNGVAALTEDDAWTVGYYADERGIYRTLAQHWNGNEWRTVPTPNIGQRLNTLTGVAMRSTDDVWAVGYHIGDNNRYLPITMHWDGNEWRMVEAPAPGKVANYLYDVALAGPTEVWAVGYQYEGSGPVTPLLMRWDGSEWAEMGAPGVDSGYVVLNSVSATSEADVWVAGVYRQPDRSTRSLVAHWDGNEWSQVSSPGNGLTTNNLKSIAAISPTNAWAVGYHNLAGRASSTLVAQYGEPCK